MEISGGPLGGTGTNQEDRKSCLLLQEAKLGGHQKGNPEEGL